MWDGGTNKQQWKKVVLSTCSASGFATRKMLGRHNINDIFLTYVARYKAENDQMCFLCFMSFCVFFQVRKKQERVLYDIRHETILRKCMSLCDFVVSSHRACIRHPMCFCVFVFFSSEKHKNTLTKCFFVFFQH